MDVSQKNEKSGKIAFANKNTITVTFITIHQSIFFLLLKLFAIEIVAAIGVVVFHLLLFSTNIFENGESFYQLFSMPLYVLLVVIKLMLMGYIIIQWLEEYYEISTKEVIHRKGLIFKKEERFPLRNLGNVKVEQNMLGRIFHYGSLTLFDWVTGKTVDLYLIHNPLKYHRILQDIAPDTDREKVAFREHLVDEFE